MADPVLADPIAAVLAILAGDAGVSAAADKGIFGAELPREVARSMPGSAIVVCSSGGASLTGDTYVEHDSQRLDLFAYGATQFEAVALANRAALVLRRVRRGVWANVLVHWVNPAGGASDGRDQALTWPRAFRSFQIMFALEEVPQ